MKPTREGGESINDDELARLRAFRQTAAEVRSRTVIDRGEVVTLALKPDTERNTLYDYERLRLLDEEAFRALLMDLRLAYMEGELANLPKIHNIVWRHGDDDQGQQCAKILETWNTTLDNYQVQIVIDGRLFETVGEIVNVFLYGKYFHRDADKARDVKALESTPLAPAVKFILHGAALLLAGCVLDMDDLVADLLGEEPVPRIGAAS